MKIPQHIAVHDMEGLYIDGRLFPHPVMMEYDVHGGYGEMTSITVTLPADCVSVNGRVEAGECKPPLRMGPFRPLDVQAERSRLATLGANITAARNCRTLTA